jgi:aminoglycoside phosphotransferase (APT) family kinase protein
MTHQVRLDPDRAVVLKRFVSTERGEAAREWRALRLLAEHVPGLAPAPIRADLTAHPPVIEMSLLPGQPLGGQALTAAQQAAVAEALQRMWASVPPGAVLPVAGELPAVTQLTRHVRDLAGGQCQLGDDPLVRRAAAAGLSWLAAAAPAGSERFPPVFGHGDANLANFLWDGTRLRIVDWEDSGLSDRPFELAALVEHISAWSDGGLDADVFVSRFDLNGAEMARLTDCRRLAALVWLLFLRPGGPASARNPPGTLRLQAERLLAVL